MNQSAPDPDELSSAVDEIDVVDKELLRLVENAIDGADTENILGLIDDLHNQDVADLISYLKSDDRDSFVDLVGPRLAPEVLNALDETVLDDVLAVLPPENIAHAIVELDEDDGIYLLEGLEDERRELVIAQIPAPERVAVLEGLAYPEDSAGRLMQRDLIAVPAFWNVGQVIDYCREKDDLPDDFYEIFVVNPRHKPIGQVRLNRMMRAKRPVLMRDIMDQETTIIPVEMDQEEVAILFQKFRVTSAPVVDDANRLLGVITFDDVADVIEEETEEDLLRLGGITTEGDLFEPVLRTTRFRFPWLAINLVTAIVASAVILQFDATIQQVVALAILMPIVASMGGNAGTQTLTIAVRALATRELTSTNAFRIVAKEVVVGGLNGLLFAILAGFATWLWFRDPALGGVIAAAMVVNMLVAGLAGALIPLGLAKVGADPAIAATVFLTTVTDVVGFFAFLGLAALFLV